MHRSETCTTVYTVARPCYTAIPSDHLTPTHPSPSRQPRYALTSPQHRTLSSPLLSPGSPPLMAWVLVPGCFRVLLLSPDDRNDLRSPVFPPPHSRPVPPRPGAPAAASGAPLWAAAWSAAPPPSTCTARGLPAAPSTPLATSSPAPAASRHSSTRRRRSAGGPGPGAGGAGWGKRGGGGGVGVPFQIDVVAVPQEKREEGWLGTECGLGLWPGGGNVVGGAEDWNVGHSAVLYLSQVFDLPLPWLMLLWPVSQGPELDWRGRSPGGGSRSSRCLRGWWGSRTRGAAGRGCCQPTAGRRRRAGPGGKPPGARAAAGTGPGGSQGAGPGGRRRRWRTGQQATQVGAALFLPRPRKLPARDPCKRCLCGVPHTLLMAPVCALHFPYALCDM